MTRNPDGGSSEVDGSVEVGSCMDQGASDTEHRLPGEIGKQ